MNSPQLNACCAVPKTHSTGSFFFEDKTVNGEIYLSMLQNFFLPEVRRLYKVHLIIFRQDGAFPHFTIDKRQ